MKKGFTLAEVLITLGIVGVVAILTVPGVMKNYANRMYVSQLQKVYSQIAEAAQNIMNDEHTDDFTETSAASATFPSGCPADKTKCTSGIHYFLNNYFKTLKTNCGTNGDSSCAKGANYYRRLDNKYVTVASMNHCIQTVSGATICGGFNPSNKCMSLQVDVNGLAQPNVAGRDVFSLDIHKNGSISDWGSGCADGSSGVSGANCGSGDVASVSQAASGCLNNIIDAGWKMEY